MKNVNPIICFAVLGLLAACNSGSENETAASTNSTTTSTTSIDSNGANASPGAQSTGNMNANTNTEKTPLSAQDSTFVVKAATGGLMEVDAGNLAQQNAASDRVKTYATMMVNDHSKSNQELMSLASGRGITLPASLPADKQKHMEAMRNMKGKSFDSHYMSMMLTDHKKTVSDFEKQASAGADADLKAWAAKTLPTLKMHLDSAQAISKGKM